ncbi:MAG TPA: LuxR C-terminal-related transcriptional regulator, partial [Anaerolineaceae bacterium]|nr:LuxR C-terminal-related transcriptional regulator [Anaerolineaceae bacterium]
RLIEQLNEGVARGCKLTLVSAPAGFGKTTLVSAWAAGYGRSKPKARTVAWLSLDEGDNDLARFIAYLVASLQTILPGISEGVLAAIQSPQPPPTESILATLLNEISAFCCDDNPDSFVLVLDDYHLIDSERIDNALSFLLDHLPQQIHLVITTREDPHLPLARYRARGQLTELRAADLRFTSLEAAEFLNQVMGLSLPMEDITALETRTEGWIAGLQLAALAMQGLSMQGRQDTASFIQAFTGSHRYVLDYLVEEVLQRQPEPIRSFLLQTSILDRLCGSLCNAITDQEDGKAVLETLDRGNLFVIPLDDQRRWYRYHHLFAEVLQTYLVEADSDQVPTLHRRASIWFEQNDLPADAIRHALKAKDFERAADLIEKVWLEMDLSYQSAAWLTWAKALPEEIIRARPVLCVGCAWALLAVGEIEACETRLRDAESWLGPAGNPSAHSSASPVVVDKAEFRVLPASIAAARAYRALALEDIPGTKMYASQALALVSDDETVHRTQATALLGMAEYAEGNLPAAEQQFLKFQAMMWQANDIANAISITYILADIMLIQGRLQEAVSAYRQSLKLAADRGAFSFLGASDLYRGLSEVLCEQGDLEGAAQQLQTAQQMGDRNVLTGWPHRLCIAQARMKEAQGDAAGALALLDEAERLHVRNPLPDRPIAALKARAWARLGQLNQALAWVSEQGISPSDNLSYLREFEHLTLARVLIARQKTGRADGDIQAALGLLARLLQAAEEGGRVGSAIEILIVQSLALQAQGDQAGALAVLERALTLAEPEGYVCVFVNEGEEMRQLIEKISNNLGHPLRGYTARLLAAFPQPVTATKPDWTAPVAQAAKTSLLEPLSDRELEVLRLLRSELTGPEIAQQLVVSLNTLRTHTKNIFNKLGANNRRAAILRAEELGLF